MNRRNKYIKEYNPSHLNPIINKASMKRAFHGTGVPTPETYTIVDEPSQLDTAEEIIRSRDEFVIKPDSGYGGEGIIVVRGRTDDGTRFETSKGEMAPAELRTHLRSILEGQYTRMGLEGVGIIEELVHPHNCLQGISGQGVPDIRVIVFQGFPIMSMTRLPTEESNGAANLHLGAVGVGLSIADGSAMGGYQSTNRWFDTHPDTDADLTEFVVPEWTKILETAVQAAEVSRLGYVGVDIVIDERHGPLVLEVNARPGLGIQNSTFDGLLDRLEFIESLPEGYELKPPAEKISLAQTWDRDQWMNLGIQPSEQSDSESVPTLGDGTSSDGGSD